MAKSNYYNHIHKLKGLMLDDEQTVLQVAKKLCVPWLRAREYIQLLEDLEIIVRLNNKNNRRHGSWIHKDRIIDDGGIVYVKLKKYD